MIFGRDFLSRYEGLDVAAVKAEWAEDLAGFQQAPAAIKFALDNLPSDKPPTSLQFRDLCRRAPQYAPKALPAPTPDPEMAKTVRQAFKSINAYGTTEWAAKLRARIESHEIRPTKFQRDALAEVSGVAE
jgi:hypothetical protein